MLRLRVAMKYFLKIKDFLTFGSKPSENLSVWKRWHLPTNQRLVHETTDLTC